MTLCSRHLHTHHLFIEFHSRPSSIVVSDANYWTVGPVFESQRRLGYVAYGAVVTIKNYRTGGGYLHSHWHLYPEGVGARQQQVTAYSHKDENNKWMIKKFNLEPNLSRDNPVELVLNGDLIRLEHAVTRRNLHSHKEVAPITKRHQQVTCYGENGTGDTNDVWRLEIIGEDKRIPVSTVTSKIRFIHSLTGCALHSDSKQLPKWGYEQMEVSCNPNLRDPNNLWNIEDNYFPKLPNVSFEVYAPSFLERFLESHAVMFQGNSGLKPKEGEITSRPWQWPINLRGQFFSGQQLRIYLLGNPVIWWGNLVLLQLFFILKLVFSVLEQRGLQLVQTLKVLDLPHLFSELKWLMSSSSSSTPITLFSTRFSDLLQSQTNKTEIQIENPSRRIGIKTQWYPQRKNFQESYTTEAQKNLFKCMLLNALLNQKL
ncbi:protein O-mannosyl-transferase 2 [Trichonephila clavipes]|nr:protein O-mannosyl-transferase 2 [Trichonephila clavipes]